MCGLRGNEVLERLDTAGGVVKSGRKNCQNGFELCSVREFLKIVKKIEWTTWNSEEPHDMHWIEVEVCYTTETLNTEGLK